MRDITGLVLEEKIFNGFFFLNKKNVSKVAIILVYYINLAIKEYTTV
jgi:hypothetical protein